MSAFEEYNVGSFGMCGWKRIVDNVYVSVVCRTYGDGIDPASEYETFVAFENEWYLFDGDYRKQLAGLTASQLREWCEAKVAEEGRQEEAS